MIGSVAIGLDADIGGFVRQLNLGLAGVDGDVGVTADVTRLIAEVESSFAAIDEFDIDLAVDPSAMRSVASQVDAVIGSLDPEVDVAASRASLAAAVADLNAALDSVDADLRVDVDGVSLAAAARTIDTALDSVDADVGVRLDDADLAGSTGALRSAFGVAGKGAALGVAAAIAGIGGVGLLGTKLAGESEQITTSLETVLGSAEAAQAMLGDLRDFAASTPFEFPGLAQSASRLLAVGTTASSVIPIMETLGDATSAMGTGSEGIDRAVMALTQMQQKGKVSAEEMMQLTEAGIPAWESLATVLGVDVATAQKMVSDGAVQATSVYQALETKAGPALERLAGGMQKQSQSLLGMASTLKDTASQALTAALEPALPAVKSLIAQVTPLIGGIVGPLGAAFSGIIGSLDLTPLLSALSSAGPAFEVLGEAAGALVSMLSQGLGGLVESAGPGLTAVFGGLAETLGSLSPLFGQLGTVLGGAFSAVAPVIVTLAGAFGNLAQEVLPPLLDLFGGLVLAVGGALQPVLRSMGAALRLVAVQLGGAFRDAVAAVAPVLPELATSLAEILVALVPLIPPLAELIALVVSSVAAPALALLAEGLALVAEGLASIVPPVAQLLSGGLTSVVDMLGRLFSGEISTGDILAGVGGILSTLSGWLTSVALPWLGAAAVSLAGALIGFAGQAVALIPGALGALLSAIGGFVTGVLLPAVGTFFAQLVPFALGWIVGALVRLPFETAKLYVALQVWIFGTLIPGIVMWVARAVPAFLGWVWDVARELPGALSRAGEAIWTFLAALPGQIDAWTAKAGSWLVDVGGDVVRGLWNGIKGTLDWLQDRIDGVGEAIVGGFKSALGIGSPSRLMADEVGRWLPPGMALGIGSTADVAIAAASALASDVVAAAHVDAPAVEIPVRASYAGVESATADIGPVAGLLRSDDATIRLQGPVVVEVDGRELGRATVDQIVDMRRAG